jgi:hypothetical protein
MPKTEVVFFRGRDGAAPAYDALEMLVAGGERKAFAKCYVRISRLAERGYAERHSLKI